MGTGLPSSQARRNWSSRRCRWRWGTTPTAHELGHNRGHHLGSVVLYRTADGVVALEDRCVHRAFPLSAGHRDGDDVVCGYHGFVYAADGRCIGVPSQENVPHGARVRAYPVIEPVRLDLAGCPGR